MFIDKNPAIKKIITFIDKPLLYVVMFLLILEGPTVYRNATAGIIDEHSAIVFVIKAITIIFIALLLLTQILRYDIDKEMLKKWGILCAVYYCVITIEFFATFSTGGRLAFIYYFGGLLPALFTILFLKMSNREGNSAFYAFSDIMLVIACISLVFWFFGSLLRGISTDEYIEADWGGTFQYPSYLGIYFERQTYDIFGVNIIRNQSIFTEAPMYNAYLIIALCVEVYMKPWKKLIALKGSTIQTTKNLSIVRVMILLITVLTTLTTTGIVIGLIIIVSMFFLYPIAAQKVFWIKLAIGIIVAILALMIGIYVIIDKSDSMSFKTRLDDYFACFKAWKTSPVFGVGFLNTDAIIQYMSEFRLDNTGLATGIGSIIAQGGLVLISIYLFRIGYLIVQGIRNRNWNIVLFNIVFVILIFIAIITSQPITFFIISLGYAALMCDKKFAIYKI